jgi:hypothetical protein
MHASISKFTGDPDDLLRRYDAMVAEVPQDILRMHLCLRAPEGIVIVDTCPSKAAYDEFIDSGTYRAMRERHGMPDPVALDDYPVHVAFLDGAKDAQAVVA